MFVTPSLTFGCVGPLRACLHQTYSVCSGVCVCFQLLSLHLCVTHTHTHVAGLCLCFSAKCLCLGVCLCVLGPQPSIVLTPSGLCVGLLHQHYHLLVLYSGPQGYNDCTAIQISSSSPPALDRYLKSGSHFRSEPDSPGAV